MSEQRQPCPAEMQPYGRCLLYQGHEGQHRTLTPPTSTLIYWGESWETPSLFTADL